MSIVKLFKPVKMPVATSALARITKQLMLANGIRQPFRICIINQPKYGAIPLSKGLILVHVGLLQQVKSPDELAFVLARELSHIKSRHIQGRKIRYMLGADILGGIITNAVLHCFQGIPRRIRLALDLVGEVLPGQLLSKVFRNQELEADLDAVRMLTNAGYSPYGYITSIVNKENDASLFGKVLATILGNDYPTAAARKAALEQYLHTRRLPRFMPKPFMSPKDWQAIKQAAARYPTFEQKSFKEKVRDTVWNGV
jgi:predicted Zn-dependent protease